MEELLTYGRKLVQFVQDSVNEAINDVASRNALLCEADCALNILSRTLLRENQFLYTKSAISRLYNHNFVGIAAEANTEDELKEKLTNALVDVVESGKLVFSSS